MEVITTGDEDEAEVIVHCPTHGTRMDKGVCSDCTREAELAYEAELALQLQVHTFKDSRR